MVLLQIIVIDILVQHSFITQQITCKVMCIVTPVCIYVIKAISIDDSSYTLRCWHIRNDDICSQLPNISQTRPTQWVYNFSYTILQ